MATLPTRSFPTIVSNIAAGMQGRLTQFLNFATGSVFLAIAEAYAGVVLWLQGMALEIAKLTRLATSYGPDADSWIGDFDTISRIGAVAATGLVVFSRYSASGSAPVVAVGSQVQTQDGTQVFAVYADSTNSAYSPTAAGTALAPIAGYTMPAQVSSVSVPVQALNAGSQGNVGAGAISLIGSSIPSVDTVTNPAGFTNGSDSESDPALKTRFQLSIASLSKGTTPAFQLAVQSLQTGMQITVQDGYDYNGTVDHGMVTVVVDDGSGNISSSLLAAAQAAIYAVKADGVRVGVFAATLLSVQIQLTVNVNQGYYKPTVQAQVAAAIAGNVNGLGLGNGLPYFTVGKWALAVDGVASINGLLVNGGTSDIAGSPEQTIKCTGVITS